MKTNPFILKENKVLKKSDIPIRTLEELFHKNIMEVVFKRRIYPPKNKFIKKSGQYKVGHKNDVRRMLCTSNWQFLKDYKLPFKWTKPKSSRGAAWYRQKKLIITWDLLHLKWRMISLDKYNIVGWHSLGTPEDIVQFLNFYRLCIKPIPEKKKKHFSDTGT